MRLAIRSVRSSGVIAAAQSEVLFYHGPLVASSYPTGNAKFRKASSGRALIGRRKVVREPSLGGGRIWRGRVLLYSSQSGRSQPEWAIRAREHDQALHCPLPGVLPLSGAALEPVPFFEAARPGTGRAFRSSLLRWLFLWRSYAYPQRDGLILPRLEVLERNSQSGVWQRSQTRP